MTARRNGVVAMLLLLAVVLGLGAMLGVGQQASESFQQVIGDPQRGRLAFAACRTCHYPEQSMGHNNGPNLHGIFGKVAGKQVGFNYYSETFKDAQFVWTPALLDQWLAAPLTMFPQTTMMSLGVADPQQRADLIAYLELASAAQLPVEVTSADQDTQAPSLE